MSTGLDEARGRGRYGRRRGSRHQLSEDEESASSYLSEGMVNDTLALHDGTDNDALPLREGEDGVASPPTTPPPGTGTLPLEELEPPGPVYQDHDEGPPLQSELPPPPALPPMLRGALTEATYRGSRPASEISLAFLSGQVLSGTGWPRHLTTSFLLLWRAQAPRCMNLRSFLRAQMVSLQHPTALLRLLRARPPLRSSSVVGDDTPCTDMRASGTHHAAVALTTPCTTTSHDTAMSGYRSPPRPPLPPSGRPPPPPPPPGEQPTTPPPALDVYRIVRGSRERQVRPMPWQPLPALRERGERLVLPLGGRG